MSWEDLQSSLRRRVQAEKPASSKAAAGGSILSLSIIGGLLVAAMGIPAAALVAYTANDITQGVVDLPLTLEDRANPQTTKLLASNGDLLAYFYHENREDVPLEEIAPVMQTAILSIEDYRFYEHGALDLKGTLRAVVNNASDGQTQGGSTITQQLVKLLLVQQATTKEQQRAATEKTKARKIRELKLAIDYEQRHSKKQILERYLNTAYFGGGAHGIAAASSHYFSVTPDELSTAQAATLAGLVQNPVEFDPEVYPERALQRRNIVLAVMAQHGEISQAESEELQASPLDLKITKYPNGCLTSIAAFSCDYIRRYLLADEALGATFEERQQRLERGGLTIKSNIDVRMQKAANDAVKAHVRATDKAVGAIALVEPGTGKVRGLAQSRPMGTDRKKGETFLNFTVPLEYGESLGFQAGSTFKIFTLAAALKEGMPVSTSFNSPPSMVIPRGTYFDCEGGGTSEWRVRNSTSSGKMNMYTGMRLSVNTYFAQLEREVGLCNTVRMAEDMGIRVPFPKDGSTANDVVPSFTLGVTLVSPLDMAAAYAVPASGGMYCEPLPINEIVDLEGNVVKKYESECERVLSRGESAQINDILRGLQQPGGFGYNRGTGLNIMSAAKTGTTNENKSVWYVGYTPELSAASMIAGANEKGQPIPLSGNSVNGRIVGHSEAAGSALAGPMWKAAMGRIQQWLSPAVFDRPPQTQPRPEKPKPADDDDDDDDEDT